VSRWPPGRGAGAAGRPRGQSLVEFSLILPLFLLAIFGLIDGARLVYFNSTLSQAVREAARTGAVEAYWLGSTQAACGTTGGPICPGTFATFKDHVVTAANRMMTPFANVASTSVSISCGATAPSGSWTGQSCSTRTPGALISVRIVQTFQPVTPVLAQIVGSLPLSGATTMVIN
jgi:hypothetical protein